MAWWNEAPYKSSFAGYTVESQKSANYAVHSPDSNLVYDHFEIPADGWLVYWSMQAGRWNDSGVLNAKTCIWHENGDRIEQSEYKEWGRAYFPGDGPYYWRSQFWGSPESLASSAPRYQVAGGEQVRLGLLFAPGIPDQYVIGTSSHSSGSHYHRQWNSSNAPNGNFFNVNRDSRGNLWGHVTIVENQKPLQGEWRFTAPSGEVSTTRPLLEGSIPHPAGDRVMDDTQAVHMQIFDKGTGAAAYDTYWRDVSTAERGQGYFSRTLPAGVLEPGKTYQARYRHEDTFGWQSDFSEYTEFSVIAGPAAPGLITPSGKQDEVRGYTYSGVYSHSQGIQAKAVEIAVYNSNGTTELYRQSFARTLADNQIFDIAEFHADLAGATGYSWSARAQDANDLWGPWAERVAFRTNTLPFRPTDMLPSGGRSVATPEFSCIMDDPDADAIVSAEIEILDASTNQTLTGYPQAMSVSPDSSGGYLATFSAPSTEFAVGAPYRWRARGSDSVGFGPYSEYQDFIVSEAPEVSVLSPSYRARANLVAEPSAEESGTYWDLGSVLTGKNHLTEAQSNIEDGTTTGFTPTNATLSAVQAGAIEGSYSLEARGRGRNLLTANQSNVETDTTGFSGGNGALIARDTTVSEQGTASLKVDIDSTIAASSDALVHLGITLEPNTSYTWRASIYVPVTTIVKPSAFFVYDNIDIAVIANGRISGLGSLTTLSPGWHVITGTGITGNWTQSRSGILRLRPARLADDSGYDSSKSLHFDSIQLAQGSATTWEPGGSENGTGDYSAATSTVDVPANEPASGRYSFAAPAGLIQRLTIVQTDGAGTELQRTSSELAADGTVQEITHSAPALATESAAHLEATTIAGAYDDVTLVDRLQLGLSGADGEWEVGTEGLSNYPITRENASPNAAYGEYVWRAASSATSSSSMLGQLHPVDTARDYFAGVELRTLSGVPASHLEVECLDASGTLLGTLSLASAVAPPGFWSRYAGLVYAEGSGVAGKTFPAGTAQARVRITPSRASEAEVEADGAQFERMPFGTGTPLAARDGATAWYGYFDGSSRNLAPRLGASYAWQGEPHLSASNGKSILRSLPAEILISYASAKAKAADRVTLESWDGERWKTLRRGAWVDSARTEIPLDLSAVENESRARLLVDVRDSVGAVGSAEPVEFDVSLAGPPELSIEDVFAEPSEATISVRFSEPTLPLEEFAAVEVAVEIADSSSAVAGAPERAVYRLSDPSATSFTYHFPVSGVEYRIRVRQVALSGSVEAQGRWAEATASCNYHPLCFVKDAISPERAVAFQVSRGEPHSPVRKVGGAEFEPWGRSAPVGYKSALRYDSGETAVQLFDEPSRGLPSAMERYRELTRMLDEAGTLCLMMQRPEPSKTFVYVPEDYARSHFAPGYPRVSFAWKETGFEEGFELLASEVSGATESGA